ncbi:transglycosylase domain-containing protein [Deinococcus petrolearius]|uniref:peptidoglycan glycosyltransferase n=1 Tax=Deinococcus petrolearius TaxID=1751295 RepID=A0ABW1DMU4_9DEIO
MRRRSRPAPRTPAAPAPGPKVGVGTGGRAGSARAATSRAGAAGRRRRRPAGCLTWVFRGAGTLLLLGAAAAGGMYLAWGRDLPSVADLDVLEYSGQTRVYDRTGGLVGTLTPSLSSGDSVNRDLLPLAQISQPLRKAVVTSEDRHFYEHHGVDSLGITRGLLKGLLRNDLEGGSSITQQVVKNTLLSDYNQARTVERKFKEALLAIQLDRDFDKNKILNAYLNIVYWGDGGPRDIVGIQSAARAYFRKDAAQLTLAESAYLATLIPAPNSRYRDFTAYRPLVRSLLDRMVEDGRVTRAQAAEAWKTPIYPAGWRIGWNADGTVRNAALENPDRLRQNLEATEQRGAGRYAYQPYLQAVEKELLPRVGRRALYGGGKIFTGMDLQAQQSAERASLNARLPDGATLGIALVNPANGEALALVGQKLTGDRPGDWNNAVQARRQVGSSIKPLLYTLALSQGWKQSDTVLDSPIYGDYQPQNYDGRWTGRFVTMRYALDHSLNLPTVRIGQEVGMDTFGAKLRQLGLTPPPEAGLSLSIGTLEASPLQMAAAYAAFANGGVYYAPSLVRRFEDKNGAAVYARPAPAGVRVWDTQTAWLGLDMLRGVVNDLTPYQGGLATRAQIPGWEVGGKTGTTNEIKDLWFAGVAPGVAGAVWVGRQEGGSLPSWAYSGDVPTPVWQQAVAGTLAGRSRATFAEPAGITYRVVRQVNMAFREAEADQEPVARDGSRRTEAVQVVRPAPEPAAPVQDAPVQTAPAQTAPAQDPTTSVPQGQAPEAGRTGEPARSGEPATPDPTGTAPTFTDPGSGGQDDTDDQSSAASPDPELPAQPQQEFPGERPTEDQLPELPPLDPVR